MSRFKPLKRETYTFALTRSWRDTRMLT